ncbi:helix-turn-helix domain-containing protein [Actinopolymorpha alba]|uniref:helix-turn-helix domain-containing protein n=1 Tax=Actinopolymorpha alba TaxID=533267 RepID=UPI00036CCCEA|nr:helix-turn-helix domain-containing protein [Actinopolymorpha alba]
MFEALGLDGDEERVYLALVPLPSASADELAPALGLTPAKVGGFLRRLEIRGLASRPTVGPDGGRYVAASPTVALGALVTLAREELRRAEQAAAALAEQHRTAARARSVADLVEVVAGAEAVRHRFIQLQHSARRELLAFVAAPTFLVHWSENAAEDAAVARGVEMKVVIERALLEEPGALAEAERSIQNGEEIRVVDALPIKLLIADRSLALVPLMTVDGTADHRVQHGAVMVHESGLLDGLIALFEGAWERAAPLRLGADVARRDDPPDRVGDGLTGLTGVTDLDGRILALLLAGFTDQAVAKQLDISTRTMQRRLRVLMDLSGTRTRLQLGWYAARHSWI